MYQNLVVESRFLQPLIETVIKNVTIALGYDIMNDQINDVVNDVVNDVREWIDCGVNKVRSKLEEGVVRLRDVQTKLRMRTDKLKTQSIEIISWSKWIALFWWLGASNLIQLMCCIITLIISCMSCCYTLCRRRH